MSAAYLDHAATTPLDPRVAAAMAPYSGSEFGNPSSRHPLGASAARALAGARAQVAAAFAASPQRVTFTSGGTEALNLAVLGIARAARRNGRRVVIGPTEHACVRGTAAALRREGFEVAELRLDARGELDLEHAARSLDDRTVLVAQMLANNEVGTVYPIARLAKLVRARAPLARLVVDAVQACGKLDCALDELGADALAISAHKLGGPKGAGALVLAREIAIEPLIHGGGQESGLRGGTENVAACVGLGAALEIAERERDGAMERWSELRGPFVDALAKLDGVRVLEAGSTRLPSIVAVCWPGAPAEVRMHHLAQLGVYVSAGSACQANKRELSATLKALGMSEDEARSTLRISMGRSTSAVELERAAEAFAQVGRELERIGR